VQTIRRLHQFFFLIALSVAVVVSGLLFLGGFYFYRAFQYIAFPPEEVVSSLYSADHWVALFLAASCAWGAAAAYWRILRSSV
jgi:hypothetical protein